MDEVMDDVVDEVVAALRDQVHELDALVSGRDDADWSRPSACPGWSVADVLVHLAQTNEIAIASVEGRWDEVTRGWARGDATVDEWAGAAVEQSAVRTGPAVHAWWRDTADAMVTAFAAVDPGARVPWVVGDMAARTLCTTRLSETWIHTTDVAHGLGVAVAPTERLWHIARLVHRTIPYAFERAGASTPGRVRFDLTAPDGSTWTFGEGDAPTVVTGPALDLCRIAGQRATAADTELAASGPDAESVLALVRTFA
jgi:uncharacterized protein (TIGR03084 family)